MQVRASEHDQGYEVVDAAEPVDHPDGQLYLVVHRLDPRVADAELDGADDRALALAHLLR